MARRMSALQKKKLARCLWEKASHFSVIFIQMKNTVTVSKWAPFLPGFSYNSQFSYMPLNLHTHTLAISHSEQSWVIYTQALATCTLTCRIPYKLWTRPEYPVHSAPSSTTAQLISLLLPRLHVLWLHSWDSPSLDSTSRGHHGWLNNVLVSFPTAVSQYPEESNLEGGVDFTPSSMLYSITVRKFQRQETKRISHVESPVKRKEWYMCARFWLSLLSPLLCNVKSPAQGMYHPQWTGLLTSVMMINNLP